jgi:hypothetical protein
MEDTAMPYMVTDIPETRRPVEHVVSEVLMDCPLALQDIVRACVAAQGLAAVLEALGELFGDAGSLDGILNDTERREVV